MRRRGSTIVSLLGLTVGLAGCGTTLGDPGGGTAQLRFVAVAPGFPAADFYVNGFGAAYGLGYESFTSYLPVNTGSATVAVHRGGAAQSMTTAQGTLTAGRQYTMLLSRGGSGLQQHLYPDREEPAPAGEIALRVLNSMEGSTPATFLVSVASASAAVPPVASFTLAAGEASAYVTLPAGLYVVTGTVPAGPLRIAVQSVTLKGTGGSVRTVIFAGAPTGEARRGVVAFSLEDADAAGAGS